MVPTLSDFFITFKLEKSALKMHGIAQWFDQVHPFFQSMGAAAAFAILSWMLRLGAGRIKRSGSEFFVSYQKMEMFKHIIHKELIKSDQLANFSKGYFMVTLEAFRWVLRGVLILVFFLAVSAITSGDWLMLMCYWFVLNCMLEASSWLKDKSGEAAIAGISTDIRDEFYEIMYPKNIGAARDDGDKGAADEQSS